MQKFITNMLYAIPVYAAIYGLLLAWMHFTSTETREYCEQINNGQTQESLESLAQQNHLETEIMQLAKPEDTILTVHQPDDQKAVCRIYLLNKKLQKKQFVQHVF